MNKEEMVKLADECGIDDYGVPDTYVTVKLNGHFALTPDELLAFANACEKIGMEKAEKICEAEKVDYSATRDLGDLAYNTAIEHVITAIRKTMK